MDTPFRKGRILLGLSGMVSSSSLGIKNSDLERKFTNNYALELSPAYFVKNRWLLGLSFGAQRIHAKALVTRETEILYAGPFARFYTARFGNASLYPAVSVYFSRYYERFEDLLGVNPVDEQIIGNGVGGALSLGFNYVMGDVVVFDLRLSFNQVWYDTKINDLILDQTRDDWMSRSDLVFVFGFAVLLNTFEK